MKYLYMLIMLGLFGSAFAQPPKAKLSGRVLSSSGSSVAGATVILVGSSYGAVTGEDGSFLLAAPAGKYRVRVTFVGYLPVEQDVAVPSH